MAVRAAWVGAVAVVTSASFLFIGVWPNVASGAKIPAGVLGCGPSVQSITELFRRNGVTPNRGTRDPCSLRPGFADCRDANATTLDLPGPVGRQRACVVVRRVAGRFSPVAAPADNTYNAAHLLVLEGLEAVRKRPGMYIGSTDTRGLMHCLWEIIDNGVDEALAGVAHRVEVTLHADGSVEVHDDGRGIPTDKEPKTGLPGVEVVATKLHAGGKFGGGSYVATGGLHGVGLSVVNALSSRMDIDVDRSPTQQGLSLPARRARRLRRRRPGRVLHARRRA